MFYMQYLSSLCQRRQWPEPCYEPYSTRFGIKCVVRVNNREYHTEATFDNEVLASENAAMRAYLICRNFSVNDGMYPAGHATSGTTQGLPVAIGRERGRTTYGSSDDWSGRSTATAGADWDERTFIDGSLSGGSSPGSDRSLYSSTRVYSSVASSRISSSSLSGSASSSGSSGSRRRTSNRR